MSRLLKQSKIRLSGSLAGDDAGGSGERLDDLPDEDGRRLPPFEHRADAAFAEDQAAARPAWWRRKRVALAVLVALPTLLTALFEFGIAADQYEAEAHFIVRSPQPTANAGGLGQLLGLNSVPPAAEAHSVGDYLLSHDALEALGRSVDLVRIFRRPEADPITRLWDEKPQKEVLLKYYRSKVHATYSGETGITTLTVRAFRPSDAKGLADELLKLGERRVNALNSRIFEDGLNAATRRVVEARGVQEDIQNQLTAYRQAHRDIDPERTGSAQTQLVADLQKAAESATADVQAMAGGLPPSAPQFAAARRRAQALQSRVAAARAGLAGNARSVAADLGGYEKLRLQQEFSGKSLEVAQTGLQAAQEQFEKQQLFIVPVVQPNLPEKALYPKRAETVALVFFGSLLVFALGWLVLAGVREHAS